MKSWPLSASIIAGLAMVCLVPMRMQAQETEHRGKPVLWTLGALAPTKGAPLGRGATLTANLHAAIQPGWHVYSLHEERGGPTAMRITVPPRGPFAISGDFGVPPPMSAIDAGFGIETHFYTGDVDVLIPLRVTRKTMGPVAVDVFYQVCDRETCLRPMVAHLTAAVANK